MPNFVNVKDGNQINASIHGPNTDIKETNLFLGNDT